MRHPIRSGKARIPADWRLKVGLPWYRRRAIVTVTGVRNRDEALAALAAHLPLIPGLDDSEDWDRTADWDDDGPDDDGPEDWDGVEDADTARRISRVLSGRRQAPGVDALIAARTINPHRTAVYVWRRAADGEAAYRLWPDGSVRAVAVFDAIKEPSPDGRPPRTRLTARRNT